MRKVVIHRPGGYGRLKIEEHPDPVPKGDEVLVGITASGVNFADALVRQGVYASAKVYVGWPITPGFEFAGKILAVGAGVADWATGQRVCGISRFGAYATHVCVPAAQIFAIPRGFSDAEAGAFPAVFLTAYHALHQHVRLRPGMHALVHSAAGGVGTALLQLAKVAGLHTTGVVGATHKVEVARRFGADVVIDKSREDLWSRAEQVCPRGFDLVLDGNGPSTLKQSYAHLAPVGKLVTYGFHSMFSKRGGFPNYLRLAWQLLKVPRFNPLNLVNDNKSIVAFNVSYLMDRIDLVHEGMGDLLAWVESKKIRAPEVQQFDFERVADAQRAIESGTTTGKLVLRHTSSNSRRPDAS